MAKIVKIFFQNILQPQEKYVIINSCLTIMIGVVVIMFGSTKIKMEVLLRETGYGKVVQCW